jgi:hypothetical protein
VILAVIAMTARILSVSAGGLAIYTSVGGVYEDEEGRLQSAIEALWLRTAYAQEAAVGRHTGVLRRILARLTRLLDRVFGPALLSRQFFGVSFALSIAVATFASLLDSTADPQVSTVVLWVGYVIGTGFLVLGLLPSWYPRVTPITVTAATLAIIVQVISSGGEPLYSIIFSWSFVVDIVVVAGSRHVYGKLKESPHPAVVVLGVIACAIVVVSIVLGPAVYFGGLDPAQWPQAFGPGSWQAGYAGLAISMNTWTLLPSLSLLGLLLTYGLHRTLWPMALRPLYLAQKTHLLANHKLMFAIGVYLLVLGLRPRLATFAWLAALLGLKLG